MQFTALEDFWSDEVKSQYCVGLSYDATDNEKLLKLVERWLKEKKVELGGPAAQIAGRG